MTVGINVHESIQAAPTFRLALTELPPLQSGDRLTRSEFERRYQSMPGTKKAELIEGVVYMPSPVRIVDHGEPQAHIIWWLTTYKLFTPGLQVGDNSTVRLDPDNEPQPDGLLRMEKVHGGFSYVDAAGYVEGAPELLVEIAASTASYDMHDKFKVYRRNGVQEYIVWRVYDGAIDWFRLEKESYIPVSSDGEGIIRSHVFPGLQLDINAMLSGDLPRVMTVLQQGVATPEHKAFVERLAKGSD